MSLFTSYYDSAEGATVDLKRVRQEIEAHGLGEDSVDEFVAQYGRKDEYDAQELLAWLGH
jgi:hypothetical protein